MQREVVPSVVTIALSTMLLSAAAHAAKRAAKDVEADYERTVEEFEGKYAPGDAFNPKYRQSLTAAALPVLTRRLALCDELGGASPAMKAKARWRTAKTAAKLAYFDDAAGKAALDAMDAAGPADATAAKLARQLVVWWQAADKPDEQAKALDAAAAAAKAEPKNEDVAQALKSMIDDNPASAELAGRAWDALATLKSPTALQLNASPNKVGKPLVISGPLVTGKMFKSDQFKGKVVLIDFWATWCPPCREELPKLAKLYADFHDKGLEIVGVSSDQNKRDLADFLKQHPEMPWPQMFVGGAGWHPLTKKFGINSIPRMYLIDRNGVLRSVTARSTVEKLVPELLAEPGATAGR